ncbi:uncharacterized protein LOC124636384 [Helicoverpa zea]|uniref:uncharacterized protein LOC124636384 n=1 Tax=Helicoverpa zea TaxID=7113 RepID=UPI001F586589|nr:uncharacterized protein LOC124636384 [Helicoverpa zea]
MDLPVLSECCFCLPLRFGLLVWGYIKLTISSITALILLLALEEKIVRMGDDRDYLEIYVLALVLVTVAINLALDTLFVVGGHKKNVKLLQIYYIYHIVLWVLTLISLIVMGFVMMKGIHGRMVLQINFFNIFLSSVLQSYFLLLLRSQIMKLKTNIDFQYLNTTAETGPKCTMQYGTAIYALEGSQDVYNV